MLLLMETTILFRLKPSIVFLRFINLYVTQGKDPTQKETKTDEEFAIRLEDWDVCNHQIITWLQNTSIPSTNINFGGYDTAKDI